MAIKGERFPIDLDSDGELHRPFQPSALNIALVSDIKERTPSSDPKPPSSPRFKSCPTGFPAHHTRTGPSKFKQRREKRDTDQIWPDQHQTGNRDRNGPPTNGFGDAARFGGKDSSIDQENKQRLAQMSEKEIEEARLELMSGLSPSLIERLLRKANIDEDRADPSLDELKNTPTDSMSLQPPKEKVMSEETGPAPVAPSNLNSSTPSLNAKTLSSQPSPEFQPASQMSLPPPPTMHFPHPPKAPDLDPSAPNFLSALHSTYFPSLPADPSAMAWMAPLNPDSEKDSAYAADEDALLPSELRFDFRGHLLPPRLSAQIPVTKGLHHHAQAPSSAGYTIPELSYLARSTYPAQRCIAYQTLGRVLYRLGRGDFGLEEDVLSDGLWRLMDEGKVTQSLKEAAAKEDQGNRSVWVTATEAVWLWRKGGGKKWRGR